jgi:hypothetical protein
MTADRILVDYYAGAYGPTIRIDVQSLDDLLVVRGMFQQLAEGRVAEVHLQEMRELQVIGISSFTLKVIPEVTVSRKTLHLVRTDASGPVLVWSRSPAGWMDGCVCLIDGLLERNAPGHQYLTHEGVDDALVELAFLEARPGIPPSSPEREVH